MGIDAVGKTLKEKCFRYERAYDIFGWSEEHILTCEDAARILTSKSAGLKGVDDVRTVFVINKADSDTDLQKALEVKKYIEFYCKESGLKNFRVVITSYESKREFCDFDFLTEGK